MSTLASENPASRAPGLAGQYAPGFPGADEMLEADGALRPHWRSFVSMMDDLGADEVMSRWEQARGVIRENGITHNIYGEPDGMARPWMLDLVPLLIPEREWNGIGDALVQRARLLNSLMADLYGPAESVSAGLLPMELVYANPWFLRPMHGIRPPQGKWLHFYAADLVRCADGAFRVFADRTQNPSGAGYCLENRIVLNRAVPTVFRQCNVHRLAPFFMSLQSTLAGLAQSNQDNPRVVLLTPGPYNETYFEHAYMARYLGYTLVQGNDLTVRDCRVYLKTLSGLQRVDVILRRVDDDFCDPLELHGGSYLGVPGLCKAIREETVSVANAIGSGIVQIPAMLPFLPALCRHFLGENLKMASVDTWWCGQKNELGYVLENLKRLVIKAALPVGGSDPVFGDELTKEQLLELAGRIKAKPNDYVAQEPYSSFSAPVLAGNGDNAAHVQSRRYVVRAYLTAERESYMVMPGGLTRVTAGPESRVVSLQKGGGSKDTWILAEGVVSEATLLSPADHPLAFSRGGNDLASRVADDLFWLGRYTQRAEGTVRLARCIFNRLSAENSIENTALLQILSKQLIGRGPRGGSGAAGRIAAELFSAADPGGLRSSLRRVRGLADVLRDRISTDAWRILRDLEREVSEFKGKIGDRLTPAIDLLNRLVAGFLSFSGMSLDSMTRGQAWSFLDIGVRIERGMIVASLIEKTLAGPASEEALALDALLEIADSSLTYRRRYFTNLRAPAVADLLLADETNPRSVAFAAASLKRQLSILSSESERPPREQIMAVQLLADLRTSDLEAACRAERDHREGLAALCRGARQALGSISDLVSQTYFSHAHYSQRQLSAAEARGTGATP